MTSVPCVVAALRSNIQFGRARGRNGFDHDFAPFSIFGGVRGRITQHVLAFQLQRDLPADGSRHLLPSALTGPFRAENVVIPSDAILHAVVSVVSQQDPL